MQEAGKRADLATKVVLMADITGAGTAVHGYLTGNKTEMAMGVAGMASGGLSGGGRLGSVGFREARALISNWSVDAALGKQGLVSLVKHSFLEHGAQVGANNLGQFLRQAAGFNKKTAFREVFDEGRRIRYIRKDGTYLITDTNGRIVSFGRN